MQDFLEKLPPLSLRMRIFLIALLAIIPVMGIMSIEFRENQELIISNIYHQDLSVAYSMSENQDGLISQTKGFLTALSLLPQVRAGDTTALNKLLPQLLNSYPNYYNILITNSNGTIIASALLHTNGNESQRSYFKKAIQTRGFSIGNYQVDYISKKATVGIAYPILDDKGQIKTVLVVTLNLEWLGTLLGKDDLPPGSVVGLLDGNGVVLARFPVAQSWVGKQASATVRPLLMTKKEGTTEGRGNDGIYRLYAFVPLDPIEGNMSIVVGVPAQFAFAGLKKTIIYDFIGLLVVIAAFFILVWEGSKWLILGPLDVLASTARRLSKGDMTARTGLPYFSEIGQLARSFDKMAASLENERKKLYALIDELPASIWVQSEDYFIRFANKRFIKNFGDPVGKICYEILRNEDTPCNHCQTIFETQRSANFEITFAEGKILEVHQRFFLDIDGCPLVLKMGLDITDKKTAEEEMIRLDRLNLVGEMAATIAHEIRNPMTTVRGFLQMLGAKEECRKYSDYYNIMIDELDSANSIITEYLSLTRKTRAPHESCNLNDLVKQIRPLIISDATGLCLGIETDLKEVPNLSMNKKEIGQLLLNLVRNGLEAMDEGSTLTIRTFTEGDNVTLAVQDQGSGIDPAVLNKLGTPFVTTKENGTGLGLSVCYAIANRNNAEINVDTGPNGTTFYIRFKGTGSVAGDIQIAG